MSGLTVREKEHWKERIGKRIDRRIEVLMVEDPNLMERVERAARQAAFESLGLATMQAELDSIKEQKKGFDDRANEIERKMLASVRGTSDVLSVYYSRQNGEIEKAVKCRQAIHEERLLADTDLGQRIIRLRHERENLLDTVWLATSGKEVRALWSKVAVLLGESPTQLQQDALAMDGHAEG